MDKVKLYIDVVGIEYVLLAAGLLAAIFAALPKKYRLDCVISGSIAIMCCGFFIELSLMSLIGKILFVPLYICIIIAALLHPGSRRKMPPWGYFYIFLGVIGFPFILGSSDFVYVLLQEIGWLLAVISALLISRTVVDHHTLHQRLRSFFIGTSIASTIMFFGVIADPSAGFARGLGRLFPFGANPNQMGMIFLASFTTSILMIMSSRNKLLRSFAIGSIAISLLMIILTASRSSYAGLFIVGSVAFVLLGRRHTGALIFISAASVAVGIFLFIKLGLGDIVSIDRVTSLKSARAEMAVVYFDVIMRRPLTGLLGTQGLSPFNLDEAGGQHAHNLYLFLLYKYGIPVTMLFVSWYLFVIYKAAGRLITGTSNTLTPTSVLRVLAAIVIFAYLHGLTNGSSMHASNPWTLVVSTFSILILMLSQKPLYHSSQLSAHPPQS